MNRKNFTVAKKTKMAARYIAIFVISSVMTLALLVYETAISTVNEVWIEEGRAFDTKKEDTRLVWTSRATIGILQETALTLEDWPVSYLYLVLQKQREMASKKIPENDFERSYLYYWAEFLPKAQKNESEIKKYVGHVFPEVVRQLVNAPSSRKASEVIKEIYYHFVIKYYSEYFFAFGYNANKSLYQRNRKAALTAVYDSAVKIDPHIIRNYSKRKTVTGIVFASLRNAYVLLANNVFVDGICDVQSSKRWLFVSSKARAILIENPAEARANWVKDSSLGDYKTFFQQFKEKDHQLRVLISRKCLV